MSAGALCLCPDPRHELLSERLDADRSLVARLFGRPVPARRRACGSYAASDGGPCSACVAAGHGRAR